MTNDKAMDRCEVIRSMILNRVEIKIEPTAENLERKKKMTDYTKIKELIDVELNEAINKKGTFVDGHQAYGVICEEMCEAGEELAEVTKMIADMWEAICGDV